MVRARLLPLLFSLVACSTSGAKGDDDDPCSRSCPNRSGVDLTTPATGFASDVYPILLGHCNSSACHGSGVGAEAQLELGPPGVQATPEEISAVYDGLMRNALTTNMALVAPGDPSRSFLMFKVEGCQNGAGLSCTTLQPNECDRPCGEPMPPLPRDTYPELAEDDILTIRRWIAQGALP